MYQCAEMVCRAREDVESGLFGGGRGEAVVDVVLAARDLCSVCEWVEGTGQVEGVLRRGFGGRVVSEWKQ